MAVADFAGAEYRAQLERLKALGEYLVPLPSVVEADPQAAKLTPIPVETHLQRARLSGELNRVPVTMYVRATGNPAPHFEAAYQSALGAPGWTTYALRLAARVRPDSGATFVLVHGAWLGGWCWRSLRSDGHAVYTPTLTGLGDRSHLLSPSLTLATHVADIANLIVWEDLHDIVLVGHSYGGMVISGVTEAVPDGPIRSIVYLDAFCPEDGESIVDQAPGLKELVGGAAPIPHLPAEFRGYTPEIEARVDRLSTPHPRRTFVEPLQLTGVRERIPSMTFVLATEALGEDGTPLFQFVYDKLATRADWHFHTLSCPHD